MKIKLREYQKQGIADIFAALRVHDKVLYQAPTGSGKSVLITRILQLARQHQRRVLIITERKTIKDQMASYCERFGIEFGVMSGNDPRYQWGADIQVSTIQTLARRKRVDSGMGFNLIVVDECFTGDTMVSTPKGQIPICLMRTGDIVHNAFGVGTVEAISKRNTHEIYCIRTSDGKSIKCTASHPFFTASGWKAASELGRGEKLVGIEDMSGLWEGVRAEKDDTEASQTFTAGIRGTLGKEIDLLEILCKEAKKSYASGDVEKKSAEDAKRYWSQAASSGWKWESRALSSNDVEGKAGTWLGIRVCGESREDTWISNQLQNRHSEQADNDGDRSRRQQSQQSCEAGAGHEEGRTVSFVRVESVSRIKQKGGKTVYNLQVSGHPSYFAEGKLVHNCHVQFKSYQAIFDMFPSCKVIGFTATPWSAGLGLTYQALVKGPSVSSLVDQGYLSGYRAYAPPAAQIDTRGIDLVAGEYHEGQLSDRVNDKKLYANIVSEWVSRANGKPTLVFATSIRHSKALCERFRLLRINAEHLDAYTDDQEVNNAIRRFRDGLTTILCSVSKLAVGFDAPNAEVGIIARPTKSLILHYQMLGRLLRVSPGKEGALILDHSGNLQELGLPDSPPDLPLDVDGKSDRKHRVPKPKLCSKCGAVKKSLTCDECGHVSKPKPVDGEKAGTLVELSCAMPMTRKRQVMMMLKCYEQAKGYGNGWSIFAYKDLFREDPPMKWPRSILTPDEEVRGWIRHLQIKRAKGSRQTRGNYSTISA